MNEGLSDHASLEGVEIEEAVDLIATESDNPRSVREVIGQVSEDGVVSKKGVQAGLSEVSLAISTVENRTEVAADALADAKSAAAEKPDIGVISQRLSTFEAKLMAIQEDQDALSDRLEDFVDQYEETQSFYEVGEELRSLAESANSIQQAADKLYTEINEFREWLSSPEKRNDSLQTDIDAIENTLSDLHNDIRNMNVEEHERAAGNNGKIENAGAVWVGAVLRCHVLELLIDDVHREHMQLKQWAAEESDSQEVDDPSSRDEHIIEQLASLRCKEDEIEQCLDSIAKDSWYDQYDDIIDDFQAKLADLGEHIDWAEVHAILETYQARIDNEE